MRHQHMGGKTAIDRNAEMARRRTDVLVPGAACGALPATNPGIHGGFGARFCAGVRSHGFDGASDFVAERKGQGASSANVELFAITQQEIPILHVQIGMADTTASDAHEHLGTLRLWNLRNCFAKRFAVGSERLTSYLCHWEL
jgi:hypothetical protein